MQQERGHIWFLIGPPDGPESELDLWLLWSHALTRSLQPRTPDFRLQII